MILKIKKEYLCHLLVTHGDTEGGGSAALLSESEIMKRK